MAGSDELGMSMDDMAAATAEFAAEMDSNPANMSDVDINEALTAETPEVTGEPEIEIEDSGFWGDKEDLGGDIPLETGSDPVLEEEVPQTEVETSDEIFSYKANGEDRKLDISSEEGRAELKKALERNFGMEKAFSESAKLKRELKRLTSEKGSDSKYKENWDKIEDLKHNPKALLEFISGQKYDELISQEVARANAYDLGTEDERRVIDYEQRIRDMEIRQKQDQSKSERLAAAAEASEARAMEFNTRTAMETEYNKHVGELNFEDKQYENDIKEAYWQKSANDLKKYYTKYGKLTNKMYAKVFNDNAKIYGGNLKSQIDSGVDKAIQNKKQAAGEKAQVASTRNYGKAVADSDLVNLSPDKLFHKMFRR